MILYANFQKTGPTSVLMLLARTYHHQTKMSLINQGWPTEPLARRSNYQRAAGEDAALGRIRCARKGHCHGN